MPLPPSSVTSRAVVWTLPGRRARGRPLLDRATGDVDGRAGLAEAAGDVPPDAAAGADDQRDAAAQVGGHYW